MTRLVLWLGAVLLAAACGDADAAGQPSAELVRAASSLTAAHAALEEQAGLAEADPAAAVTAWPEVEARVGVALEEVPELDTLGLEPRERSALVGYARGLEVAVAAWAEVHAELADGRSAAAERAATAARDRMRHVDRLRAGVTP